MIGTEYYSFRTLVQYCIAAVGLLLVLMFVIFQARYLIVGPRIVITTAPSGPQNVRTIEIAGVAYNISRLWLNDRPIFTNATGNFKEAIVLENGYTITTLRAEDRYGRSTKVDTRLVYVPQSRLPNE